MQELRQCFLCSRWFLAEHVEALKTPEFPVSVCKGCLKHLKEGEGLLRREASDEPGNK